MYSIICYHVYNKNHQGTSKVVWENALCSPCQARPCLFHVESRCLASTQLYVASGEDSTFKKRGVCLQGTEKIGPYIVSSIFTYCAVRAPTATA